MQISLIGGRDLRLGTDWRSERSFTLIGGSKLDATATPANGEGRIKAISIVGGADITVPRGARVRLMGGSLLGGRRVDVTPGDGPVINILACSLVGGVHVHEGA
ncbi:MAG: hypothetical protein U0Y82_05380 [Thermoleophilia bacterium]